jgi:hypothetical protein
MSIGSIDSSTSALSFTPSSQSTHRHHQLDLSKTAQLLGVSPNQLSSDLQSGQTLSSLAKTAGVSSSNLLSSVEADLKANAPQGAPALSGTQLAGIATSIINGTGPTGGSGSTTSSSSTDTATTNLTSLAGTLGMTPSDLLAQINSGNDLSQLLGSTSQTGYGSTTANSVNGGVIFDQYA